jgi:DNA-binding NtrC family response regulator
MPAQKIVIVDDDETIRKTFFLLFSKKYRVYPVPDSKEALSRFRHQDVDLIIADYKLPGLNGMELIGKFREAGYEGEAILITAFPDQISIRDLGRYAISQFFVKPLDLEVLNKSVDRLLFLREQLAQLA